MTKNLVKKVICFAVMAVVMIALIIGDVFAWRYSLLVDGILGINDTDFSNASAELQAGDKLVVELEEDSITLFKNENKTLPLADSVNKLNVFGYGSYAGFLQRGIGSGSSTISKQKSINLQQALTGYVRDFDIEDELKDNPNISDADKNVLKAQWGAEHLVAAFELNPTITQLYATTDVSTGSGSYTISEKSDSALTDTVLSEAYNYSHYALFTVSRTGGENIGEIPDTYNELTTTERAILTKLKTAGFTVIVLINTANTMHLGWLDDLNIDACINVGLTGQSGARAIPEILRGKKFVEEEVDGEDGTVKTEIKETMFSPSGRFTDIVTKSNAVVKNFDPTYANRAPSGGGITYAEGIYYGYKWYETADIEGFYNKNSGAVFDYDEVVQYPFGYGLSYTTFEKKITGVTYGENNTKLNKDEDISKLPVSTQVNVTVEVKNTGDYAGSETVQLYYTPEYKNTIEKAHVNLLDFGKTGILKPKATEVVTVSFTLYDLASYDCYDQDNNNFWGYELEDGKYTLKLMDNSHTIIEEYNLNCSTTVNIDKDPVTDAEITNRFTATQSDWTGYNGKSYSGLGTDGYEGGVSRDLWMTRANFDNTFPTKGATPNSSVVTTANRWLKDDELGAQLPDFNANNIQDKGVRIVKVATYSKPVSEVTDEDKPVSVENATLAQLNRERGALTDYQKFEYDWDLIAKLASNYNSDEWEELLNQIPLSEMKDLIELGGFRRVAVLSAGMPRLYDYDGPAGFNTNSMSGGWGGAAPDTASWTAYESEALIGCSWNKGLMLAMGLSMGAEANVTNVNGWYGPGVNLHRSSYTARNYEYYSEDGVLSGKLAAYVIAGAKINNINCYLKHFVCSEEGPNPGGVNTWITEQNLRENYLRPFEIAVKEGGSNSIMTAFNNVGANWAGANYAMNIEVLRGEWGFNGALITDWTQGGSLGGMYTRQGVRAGNDLWLNPQNSINNGLNSAQDAKYMRNSTHNLLFAYVDTLNNYNMYQKYMAGEEVEGLEVSQQLAIQLAKYGMGEMQFGSSNQGYSWWKPVLIVIDVLVGLGFIVWALYLTGVLQKLIAMVKKTHAKESAADSSDNVSASEAVNDVTHSSEDKQE